jgi:hypothetical protein
VKHLAPLHWGAEEEEPKETKKGGKVKMEVPAVAEARKALPLFPEQVKDCNHCKPD